LGGVRRGFGKNRDRCKNHRSMELKKRSEGEVGPRGKPEKKSSQTFTEKRTKGKFKKKARKGARKRMA